MIRLNNSFFYSITIFLLLFSTVYSMEVEPVNEKSLLQIPSKLKPLFDKRAITLDCITCKLLAKQFPERSEHTAIEQKLGNFLQDEKREEINLSFDEFINMVTILKKERTECVLTGQKKKKLIQDCSYLSPCCHVDRIIDAIEMIYTWQEYIHIFNEKDELNGCKELAMLTIETLRDLLSTSCKRSDARPLKTAFSESFGLLNIYYKDCLSDNFVRTDEKTEAYLQLMNTIVVNSLKSRKYYNK